MKMLNQFGFNQAQANGYAPPAPAPQTLLSAEGRLGDLNSRLNALVETATKLAETIGGPRPVGEKGTGLPREPGGIVNRLHLCADNGFAKVDHLEDLLNSIARSLG